MAEKKAVKKQTKTAPKKKTLKSNDTKKNTLPIYMILSPLIAVLLGVFMYIENDGGIIGRAIKETVLGLFGISGYFLPVVVAGVTVYLFMKRDIKKYWIKFSLLILSMINIGAIIGLSFDGTGPTEAYSLGRIYGTGGGFLGTCIEVFTKSMVQKAASYIILIFTLLLLCSFISEVSIFSVIGKFLWKTFLGAKDGYKRANKKRREREYEYTDDDILDDVFTEHDNINSTNDALEAANSFAFDTRKKKKRETRENKKEKRENEFDVLDSDFSNGIDEVFGSIDFEESIPPEEAREKEVKEAVSKEALRIEMPPKQVKETEEKPERVSKNTEKENMNFHEELNAAIEREVIEYIPPTIELLSKPKEASGDLREEMRRTAEKLIKVLDNFNVKAKLLQVTQGPAVTRYEIQPDTGVKLSKIVGLADDIALHLAVSTVLVTPVPGKAAVGVEIPNNKVNSVSIREMIESSEFLNAKSKLSVALGKDIGGNVVVGDIAKMPHVLIAGATGSGKSVCINTIIMSILYKASPEEVKLIMVDPKVVELGVYNGIPHLLIPVVTEPKKAAGALNWAVAEMMRRYDLFKDTGVRKLESYNKLMEARDGDKLPQIVIIIDELADLMMVAAKEVEDYVCRLAQLARAAGIHLIIATQRPSVDVITGLIKANIPSRIAFAVSSQVDSRTILDRGGADKLLGMGDMLYSPMGARSPIRVQGAFVSDAEIENVLGFIKENMGENHYSEDLAEHIERCSSGENGVTPDTDEDGDALLPDAISLAVELGKISTSMVQRRLGVGYSRAGRIIDQMEARGIISGANGSKPRDVLISHADMTYDNMEESIE